MVEISISGSNVTFRTPFSEKYNLIQIFKGIFDEFIGKNSPVDFLASGFQHKSCRDIWHIDKSLAINTDDVTPALINGCWMGANHGQSAGVAVYSPGHGKDYTDLGSLWEDEKGIKWTLINVLDGDGMIFMSENIGNSKCDYKFASEISGKLTYISHGVHTNSFEIERQSGNHQIHRSYRHLNRGVYAVCGDTRTKVYTGHSGCDYAEIIDEYEIINPATLCDGLRADRPEGGYTAPQDLAKGEAMFHYLAIYRIMSDGTVVIEFKYKPLCDINASLYLGFMYQERCNAGGGIYRYIPKLLPFTENDITFDFSVPINSSAEPFVKSFYTTKEYFENPDSPPDRQIDFIKDEDGNNFAAFAGGYIPVHDGHPDIRKNNINFSNHILLTRKTYPFIGSRDNLGEMHGVGYKKYFDAQNDSHSLYTVPFEGKKYLYIDFFAQDKVEYDVTDTDVTLFEKSENVTYETKDGKLYVTGNKGYFVAILSERK